jgi:site-specific recombinase XerC
VPDGKPLFGGKVPTPLPWKPLPHMETYLREMVEDEKSLGYIQTMRRALARVGQYAEQEDIKNPGEIDRRFILRYQAWLYGLKKEDGSEYNPAYQEQTMKLFRTWLSWLVETDRIAVDPWVDIKVGNTKRGATMKPLSDDEIQQIFEAHMKQAFTVAPFAYHRRESILIMLFGWGLSTREIQQLNLSHVDMRLRQVIVSTHTGTKKELPYGDEMKNLLQRWLIQRARKAIPEDDALFIDMQGRRMSTKMIYKIINELGTRAGVRLSPLRLRETFGATLLDSGIDLDLVMRMMGVRRENQALAYARPGYDRNLVEAHREAMTPFYERLFRGGERPKGKRPTPD